MTATIDVNQELLLILERRAVEFKPCIIARCQPVEEEVVRSEEMLIGATRAALW